MSDDFLRAHSPQPWLDTAPSVLAARAAVQEAGQAIATIPDGSFDKPWPWRGGEADVRFGAFHGIETIEAATGDVAGVLGAAGAPRRGAAARRIAVATVPRWQLHGRLAALNEGALDVVAKDGEWTIRETLAHIIGSQRGYATFTAWYWHRNRDVPPTEEELEGLVAEAALPEESAEGEGRLDDLRARLDATTDLTAALATIPDEDMGRWARYSGIPVDVGFRLGRPSSHVMEHAIQIDKTLAWMNHEQTEAQRIARDLFDAYGRLEALLWPRDPVALAARNGGRSVDEVLGELSATLVEDARTTVTAAAG